ncbi:flavin monoamine oxidase family protein [Bdellovibrio sp. HCB2-146]|uniref:flavin monoamine oxidase family protein n=1 Tax=Bdellovibrio sp. HCB2-146 TaxID=3394362 RepID=UPI0039BD35EA
MAKSSFSRRKFLELSALSSSAMLLSSCSSLDRYFTGDKRNLNNEVVILGGGAAGLSAAFALKKRKVPFRVFEASSRIGGRVQSVTLFPEKGPVGEMGAEFFEDSHRAVFDLAKELNLPVKEIKGQAGLEAHLFAFDQNVYKVKDLASRMSTLTPVVRRIRQDLYRDQDVMLSYKNSLQFERSVYYDSLSLKDLLESWRSEVDPLILSLIEAQAVSRFGVDAKDQSALHFLSTLDAEGSSLLSGRSTYRMEGGLSELMNNLYQRVAGVISDSIVTKNSPLVEIEESKGVFEMTFLTPKGRQTFTSKNVICTLPFSCLRDVKGIDSLEFSDLKKEAIQTQSYATQSKGTLAFTEAFWRKPRNGTPANLGNFTGNFITQKLWDSGRSQEGTQGLLTYQRAGDSGLKTGASATDEALRDLQLFYKDLPAVVPEGQVMANWTQRTWNKGSMAYFKPGQYMKFRGAAGEPEYGGRFLFAGEHTSLRFAGTLQGAIESGQFAASSISI